MGIDEVGRGCWAGPLVAGAVVLPQDYSHTDSSWKLADSKRMTARQRQQAAEYIPLVAVAYGLGWVASHEVDHLGLTAAVRLAMRRAWEAAGVQLAASHTIIESVIIDGSINFLEDIPRTQAVIKADDSVPAVSAASILAKVARDDWMAQAAKRFPGYGFERHVGYGTAEHKEALQRQGICDIHRKSYRPIAKLC